MTAGAIAIFDSGMGGLTVLKALRELLPQEDFIYLGDTARLPYGTKSPETIIQYCIQNLHLLLEHKIKMIVIACNTASAVALPYLKIAYPDIPIVGVIDPGSRAAVSASVNGRVLVLATEATIKAQGYQNAIAHLSSQIVVNTKSCSVLVSLAEEGWIDNAVARSALETYVLPSLQSTEADCIVFGCTHFPVFRSLLSKMIAPSISIVDSAYSTAEVVKQTLIQSGLSLTTSENASVLYYVTDSPDRFARIGGVFLGEPIDPINVQLIEHQRMIESTL